MIRFIMLLSIIITGCKLSSEEAKIVEPIQSEKAELFYTCRDMCAGKVSSYSIFEGKCICREEQ